MYVDGLPCFVCQAPTGASEPLFTSQGDWLPSADPLGYACGAFAHWDCYAVWPQRKRFAHSYFDYQVAAERSDPDWDRAYQDDWVLVTVNADASVATVAIVLAETGTRTEVRLFAWEQWLRPQHECPAVHACEKRALDAVRPVLRIAVPTPEALLVAIDPERKASLWQADRAHRESERFTRIAQESALPKDRMAFLRWLADVRTHGLACPHCRLSFADYRQVARQRQRVSMICPRCGKKMWHADDSAAR